MNIEDFKKSVEEQFNACGFSDNVSFGLLVTIEQSDGTWLNFHCGPKLTMRQFFYFMNTIHKQTKNDTSRSATDTSAQ